MDQDDVLTAKQGRLHNLAVNSKEERPVFDAIEVKPVEATSEVESSNERPLVSEQGPVDKIHSLSVF